MKRKNDRGFPDRAAIVAFIKANPGKVGTREIAREFGLKNADRIELKRMLRELADDGLVKKKRHTISEPDSLPPTLVADITGRDADGELVASPTEWDEVESGEPPKILITMPRRPKHGTAAGVGDRALLRVERSDETEGPAYRGHIIKVFDKTKSRILGVFRSLPEGGGRIIPVDKKSAYRELNIAPTETHGAHDGDLVSVDIIRSRGFGLASGRVKEKLGSVKSEKAISLIAIYAHDIPMQFRPAAE
ncbi:MAG: ribonuclease R, partial [Bradyrhizobium sp.]|nr:ribonuclease R [Bradyrhizobium sp.]